MTETLFKFELTLHWTDADIFRWRHLKDLPKGIFPRLKSIKVRAKKSQTSINQNWAKMARLFADLQFSKKHKFSAYRAVIVSRSIERSAPA